jgi:Ca-activated chloride channel family protein
MRRLSSLLLLLSLIAGLSAQQPPAPGDVAVFTSDTRRVDLAITVTDRGGKLVTDLPEKAFKVYENGVEQPIKLFKREDVPISLGLIIDNSGSMKEKRQKVETASIDLVKASNPKDEVFIVNFNDEAYLDVEFTNDIKLMQDGLAKIDARGGTAMREAIDKSIDYLKKEGKRTKKVLLVVTDGNDNASTINIEKLINRARQAEVLIFAIGLLNEEEKREAKAAKRSLDALALESGGLSFYPKGLADVDKIALQVAQEIRNQYSIVYAPVISQLDGSFRQIKVTVNGPGHPIARTRTGYYATPDAAKKTTSQTH